MPDVRLTAEQIAELKWLEQAARTPGATPVKADYVAALRNAAPLLIAAASENDVLFMERDALEADRDRLRAALEEIAKRGPWYIDSAQLAVDIARAALKGGKG